VTIGALPEKPDIGAVCEDILTVLGEMLKNKGRRHFNFRFLYLEEVCKVDINPTPLRN